MSSRYKIVLSLSLVLAIFYTLPWIALSEHGRFSEINQQKISAARVFFLFTSVFLTSALLFQYNLFWKNRTLATKKRFEKQVFNLIINVILLLFVSGVLILISAYIFNINAERAFFIFYLSRNTVITIVVMLVTYVIELLDKSRIDKIEILTLQNQNSETELSALRSQIDPHFLFNSLASLSGLIRANSKEAVVFVEHLSETFRYILEKREHKVVMLKDELHFVDSYIFMIRKRFDQGFKISINIDDKHFSKYIPQFALQITIENAIKHNLISVKNPLIVDIDSLETSLRIKNNLQPKKMMPGYGIGLTNLSKRYQLISGKNIVTTKTNDHFEVELPLL
jgi:sensor histidine kinase YesM